MANRPSTVRESPAEEQRYSFTVSLTSALDGCAWLMSRPGRISPGNEIRYLLYSRLGGPQCPSGRLWKISPTPYFDPRTVQRVENRYTECATPAHTT